MKELDYIDDIRLIVGENIPISMTAINLIISTDGYFFLKDNKISFMGKCGENGGEVRLTPTFPNKGKGYVKASLKKWLANNRQTFNEGIADCLRMASIHSEIKPEYFEILGAE